MAANKRTKEEKIEIFKIQCRLLEHNAEMLVGENYDIEPVVKMINYDNNKSNEETTSISSYDTYSCAKPKNIKTMDCCKTCTSRQPNVCCKYLKIKTVYIED